MKGLLKMTWMHIKLSYRIKVAFYFTFLFPLVFFFLYASVLGHGNGEVLQFFMGPLLSIGILSSALFGMGLQLVMMRERDMLRRYHLAPVGAWQMVGSRLLGNYLVLLPVALLQFVLAIWMYHMRPPDHPFGLWLVFTLGYAAVGAIGMVIAGVVNTVQEAQVFNQLVFLVLLFFSGSTMPLQVLSPYLRRFALFLPPTFLVLTSQDLMIGHGSLASCAPELWGLLFSFVTAFGVGIYLFRWEKEEKATGNARLKAALMLIPVIVAGLWMNLHPGILQHNLLLSRELTGP